MRANAATESLIELIRHACQRLLWTVAEADQTHQAEVVSQLDQNRLFGSSDEVKEYRLERTARSERLQTTVVAAVACQAAVRAWLPSQCDLAQSDRQAVENWLKFLDKILTDEVAITRNEQRQITSVTELPKKKKGKYRIASATDPEATHRVHDKQMDFGYNASVAATDSFIQNHTGAIAPRAPGRARGLTIGLEEFTPRGWMALAHDSVMATTESTFTHAPRAGWHGAPSMRVYPPIKAARKPVNSTDKNAPRMKRIISAGMDARAILTKRPTIAENGMLASTILTSK